MGHPKRPARPKDSRSVVEVPGAEHYTQARLPDLTTGWTVPNGYSDALDGQGLNDADARNPGNIAGMQLDGYFEDTPPAAPYQPNQFNGWNHDAQFVIRLPDRWNGGLVIAPPPGNRRQYAGDFIIGDWVLARGYAYASSDKGNWGPEFYRDGSAPGDAIVDWHRRVRELTVAARATVGHYYNRAPQRVFLFGLSNGGYLARYALEHDPELYDGGVDWAGTFWHHQGPNLLSVLPAALRWFGVLTAASSNETAKHAARAAMFGAGFARGSEPLWPLYNEVYWGLTQRIYRLAFDAGYDGDESDYAYHARPAHVHQAVERVALTGRLERPLITVHGSLDALLPPATNAEAYAALVARHGSSEYHRYYLIAGGQHTDGFARQLGGSVRPMLPFARAAFVALERWVLHGEPPTGGTIEQHDDERAIATYSGSRIG